MNQTKKCPECGNEKPLDDFHQNKKAQDGRQRLCKTCMNDLMTERNWAKQGIDMTLGLRSLIAEGIGNRCAICGRSPEEVPGPVKELAVDHDHRTTKVRSLLCQRCNNAIGLFDDSPELLRIAADYLEFCQTFDELVPDDPKSDEGGGPALGND